jgi:hypothetical protein
MIIEIISSEKINLILIGVFGFLKWILESSQALFHSHFLFPNFLGQVIHFYKFS